MFSFIRCGGSYQGPCPNMEKSHASCANQKNCLKTQSANYRCACCIDIDERHAHTSEPDTNELLEWITQDILRFCNTLLNKLDESDHEDPDVENLVSRKFNELSANSKDVLRSTTVKQRRKADADEIMAREIKNKKKSQMRTRKQASALKTQHGCTDGEKKAIHIGDNSKAPHCKSFIATMNERLDGPEFVPLRITDEISPITTGVILITLESEPVDGVLNDFCILSNIDLLPCNEYSRYCVTNGDKIVGLRRISRTEENKFEWNVQVKDNDMSMQMEDNPLEILKTATYPIHAIFQRATAGVLRQGFARSKNARNVLTAPTAEHISYIKILFDLPEKLQGLAMRNKMKNHFPHPRDHLTGEQIQAQISKFTRQKKILLLIIMMTMKYTAI